MHKKFYDLPEEVFDICNDAGLRGHYWCTRHAAKLMVPRKSGLIVEIGSLGGICYVYNIAYGVNKVATDRLAADVALELKEFGITSVSICSGPVQSELYSAELGLVQTKVIKYTKN
jgi:dehydrogenase/reductase SDR family protein 1